MSDNEARTLHEELEIRVIALLTGELPESEADELEKILSVDEALADFRDRMAALIGDVHTAREEISPDPAHSEMRLSPERRREIFPDDALLVETSASDEKKRWRVRWWELAAVFVIAGLLAAILIPSVGTVREMASKSSTVRETASFEIPPSDEMAYFAADSESLEPNAIQSGEHRRQRGAELDEKSKAQPLITRDQLMDQSGLEDKNVDIPPIQSPAIAFGRGGSGGMKQDGLEAVNRELAQVEEALAVESRVPWDHIPTEALRLMKKKEALESKKRAWGGFANESDALGGESANVAMSGPVDPFAAPAPKPAAKPQVPSASVATGSVQSLDYAYDKLAEAELFKDNLDEVMESEADGAYRQNREHMLAQVEQAWERPKVFDMDSDVSASPMYIPPTLEERQQSIVIPQVNFAGMPLSKVIETLNELSVEYDPKHTGVRMDYTPVNGEDPRINISLRNLSLDRILQFVTQQANHEFVVADDRILIQPQGQSAIEQMAQERLRNTAQRPKPEMATSAAPVSTFSLNVSDVSFKLAQAALESQRIPDPELIRSEEFVNSFSYGDPAPREDEPVVLNWEIAQHPYEHNRQIVRFSLQTQAAGRAADQALNLNVLLDNSGSMQRPDRRAILEQSLHALQGKLTDRDQLNIILFARQPKLIARAGSKLAQQAAVEEALQYQPEGGTNLEAGLQVAYETAHQHYDPAASNRVILMTDGAANLGDVDASALSAEVVEQRKQGIALDAYGIGWEDYNDALLEEITRNGDGRYAFLNSADTAAEDFAEKLAGTLRVAAADVKVQIIWNPERVTSYRQIGYDLHQLKAQDFRDNSVDAAEIGEAESGTALYVLKINEDPDIVGGLGTLQVRYRVPATGEYVERAWPLEMPRQIPALQDATASLRLAAASAFFAERLADNPYASNYSFEDLEALTADLPQAFPAQPRVVALQNMIQSANTLYTRFDY